MNETSVPTPARTALEGDTRLPLTLVTGFLGSGKTTLLSRLLKRPDMDQVAVIINEFGEVPLDQALIHRPGDHLVVLAGGCLCCALRGDLVSTLTDLLKRRVRIPFNRVIIETSGLADPGPILAPLLHDPELTPHFRVDGVVATVDAIGGERELGRERVSLEQVAIADRIVLTKSDIAAPRAVARLQQLLARINRFAPVLVANHGDVAPDWLLSPIDQALEQLKWAEEGEHVHDDHDHDEGVESFCLWFDRPLAWSAFGDALARLADAHGEGLLRVKGLLALGDGASDGRPSALHGVGHYFHPPMAVKAWPDGDTRSRLIFITDRLAEAAVRPFFADFLAQGAPA
jgi:G3E family GTPase